MLCRKVFLVVHIVSLSFFISCLHSRTTAPTLVANNSIIINSGNAILNINGKINENLYLEYMYDKPAGDDTFYYGEPIITEGTITKNETQYLSTGEKYTFSVLPTEVVIINITSLDDDDVEISVFEYGKEQKNYHIQGTDKVGIFLAFQNR